MTLDSIVKAVAKGYFDQAVFLSYWDPKNQRPRDNPYGGDSVALAVIRELYETYDPALPDEEQVAKAIDALTQISSDVTGCIESLKILQLKLKKRR